VIAARKDNFKRGLYLTVAPRQKEAYTGISGNLASRISARHHALDQLGPRVTIWLGVVGSFGIPGPKPARKVTDRQVDLVEWVHAHFVPAITLNKRKKINPPREGVTVVNRWWRSEDYDSPHRRPYRWWPSVIDFVGPEYGPRLFFASPQVERNSSIS